MAELDLRFNPITGNGYPHDPAIVYKDLYFLAAIVSASKGISQLKEPRDEDSDYSLFSIFRNFEYAEISKRILSIAVICRNELQVRGDKSKGMIIVGTIKNKREPKKDISLYQACNKIIHADNINFDLTNNADIRSGYLKPVVHLYGTEREKEWKVVLHIFPFIQAVFRLF